jgi:hypothetical protein
MMVGCTYAAWDFLRVDQFYTEQSKRAPAYRDETLSKIKDSFLFKEQVRFAELRTTALTIDNAEHINLLAKDVLHYSAEPRVVKKLMLSAILLNREDELEFYARRFAAAF